MFSKKNIFAFALVIAIVSAQNLVFDLRSVKYSQDTDFWNVNVPCVGGSGQYTFEYQLPNGWRNEGNIIKIPTASTKQTNNQYVVRCKVRDNNKD